MNANELMKHLVKLNENISYIFQKAGMEYDFDRLELDIDYNDPEDILFAEQLYPAMEKLASVKYTINYFSKPITATGVLHKNRNERYSCDYHEFTCGDRIEYYAYDYDLECYKWHISRVEHDGNDYYIVASRNITKDGEPIPMDGLEVRFRY
jgi:hypothetical protein